MVAVEGAVHPGITIQVKIRAVPTGGPECRVTRPVTGDRKGLYATGGPRIPIQEPGVLSTAMIIPGQRERPGLTLRITQNRGLPEATGQ